MSSDSGKGRRQEGGRQGAVRRLARKFLSRILGRATGSEGGLPWTGERLVEGVRGSLALYHLHRYAIARDLAVGKAALDIACGEGYGANLLAETASKVIGVDCSEAAIAHAKEKYRRENLEFRVGDCLAIPVESESIDLAVSFETIEHIAEHELMLAEIKRVLRQDGALVISSVDREQHPEIPEQPSPFHVKELSGEEFRSLLQRYFVHVAVLGQAVTLASIVWEPEPAPLVVDRIHEGTLEEIHSAPSLLSPHNWIGLCSDHKLPALRPGLFEDRKETARLERAAEILNSKALRRARRRL